MTIHQTCTTALDAYGLSLQENLQRALMRQPHPVVSQAHRPQQEVMTPEARRAQLRRIIDEALLLIEDDDFDWLPSPSDERSSE